MGGPSRQVDISKELERSSKICDISTKIDSRSKCNQFSAEALKEYNISIPKVKDAIGGSDESPIGAQTLNELMIEGMSNKTSGITKVKSRAEANQLANEGNPVVYSSSFHTGIVQPETTLSVAPQGRVTLYTSEDKFRDGEDTSFGSRTKGTASATNLYAITNTEDFNKFASIKVSKTKPVTDQVKNNIYRDIPYEPGETGSIMGVESRTNNGEDTKDLSRVIRLTK